MACLPFLPGKFLLLVCLQSSLSWESSLLSPCLVEGPPEERTVMSPWSQHQKWKWPFGPRRRWDWKTMAIFPETMHSAEGVALSQRWRWAGVPQETGFQQPLQENKINMCFLSPWFEEKSVQQNHKNRKDKGKQQLQKSFESMYLYMRSDMQRWKMWAPHISALDTFSGVKTLDKCSIH